MKFLCASSIGLRCPPILPYEQAHRRLGEILPVRRPRTRDRPSLATRAMVGRGRKAKGKTICIVWIVFFISLAGFFWPRPLGIACMGLAYAGILHLAVLAYDEITGATSVRT